METAPGPATHADGLLAHSVGTCHPDGGPFGSIEFGMGHIAGQTEEIASLEVFDLVTHR